MEQVPRIAFIGLVERVAHVQDGNTQLRKYNLIGLKQIVLSTIFPIGLGDYGIALAFFRSAEDGPTNLCLVDQSGHFFGSMNVSLRWDDVTPRPEAGHVKTPSDSYSVGVFAPPDGWTIVVIPPGTARFLIPRPGIYSLRLGTPDGPIFGQFNCVLVEPQPLTPERVAAIRSDPNAIEAVKMSLSCDACRATMNTYAGLERKPDLEAAGVLWHGELPDSYRCDCGKIEVDLAIMRRNLPSLLGLPIPALGGGNYVRLYEETALTTIRANFAHLLRQDVSEEVLQRFIEDNPILLHQFTPERIFAKAPILTKFRTDFAILNHQHELLLIEIERPSTKVLKRLGGTHSELQHAFDQIADWLQVADDHRAAVLSCIGIESSAVGAIKGVVVAGRDSNHHPERLRKLKGTDRGRVSLLTYDDLLAALDALIKSFGKL